MSAEKLKVLPSLTEWYAGQKLFITGATGFMGKVLVEKLLRDCSEIETIYLLVRSKRGVEPKQRLDEYLSCRAFDFIRKNNPKIFERIKIIKGDVAVDDLGLSDCDRNELIANVTTVFHCAACVRFDQPLRDVVNLNTMGTYRMLKLCEFMTNLKVFVHVSTAYCQCNEDELLEKGYLAPHRPLGIVQMTKMLDTDVLLAMTPKLLNNLPNTYAYTKALTEELVTEFSGKLPIVIARPSIVTAAFKEPYPGWVEGMNGPTGLIVGAGRGIIRSMHCNPGYTADLVPVDLAINALIAIACERALCETNSVCYYNVTNSDENKLKWGDIIETGRQLLYQTPLEFFLWFPDGSIKSSYIYHMICVIFFHYLPAYFIDMLLFIFRQKTFLVKAQRRVSDGLKLLQYYTTKQWIFKNNQLQELRERLNEADKQTFNFDIRQVDWPDYIKNYILGTREFLLKEKPETIPKSRILLKRLYYLDRLVTFLFYVLIIYLVWNIGFVKNFTNSIYDYIEAKF